jgi:hypothetical protein
LPFEMFHRDAYGLVGLFSRELGLFWPRRSFVTRGLQLLVMEVLFDSFSFVEFCGFAASHFRLLCHGAALWGNTSL